MTMLTLLLSATLAASPAPLTPELLRERYAGLRSLEADVLQVKAGRFWALPFQSRIRFRYTSGRVVWETLAPVHSVAIIQGDQLTVTGADGKAREMGGLSADPRMTALLRFLRTLMAVDLIGLERYFVLAYGPREVVARPRPTSDLKLFEAIRLHFDDDAELTGLDLETATERTRLTFEHTVRDPPPPAPRR